MKRERKIMMFCFALLMAGLGMSDALRGIFAPVFQERYGLSDRLLSWIVVASYLGNLLFLSVGGKLLDRFPRRKVMAGAAGIWLAAALLNLTTDRYGTLVAAMFLALGSSTLLNTSVNIMTPVVCTGYAGLMVNVFFFIQGLGTSGSQFLFGHYAFSYQGWRMANAAMAVLAIFVIAMFLMVRLPRKREEERENGKGERTKKAKTGSAAHGVDKMPSASVFFWLAAMMGFYFIGEHSIMNWFLSYCIGAFQMEASKASISLSLFWGGMTAGRLLFAPAVQKIGVWKSILIFGAAGTILFGVGCILGAQGIVLLGVSGFALSILYPTMILMIQQIYPQRVAAGKTGAIISLATVADILFNAGFGSAIEHFGYRMSFLILPLCMAAFYLIYLHIFRKQRLARRRA